MGGGGGAHSVTETESGRHAGRQGEERDTPAETQGEEESARTHGNREEKDSGEERGA